MTERRDGYAEYRGWLIPDWLAELYATPAEPVEEITPRLQIIYDKPDEM